MFVDRTPVGIVGCESPDQPGTASTDSRWALGYFQTCGDGWVNAEIKVPAHVSFGEQSRLFVGGYDGSAYHICQFGTTCTEVIATPEPASFVLVGSGMIGVFAGFRRRRSDVPLRQTLPVSAP